MRKKIILKKILRRKIVIFGIIFLFLLLFVAIFPKLITPIDPLQMDVRNRLSRPSSSHWFGTDMFGRDIYSRVIHGANLTLKSGLGVVILSIIFGTIIAIISAYYTRIGNIFMRLVDVVMSFPSLILALVFIVIFGRGFVNVVFAVGIGFMVRTARIIYGVTLKTKSEVFIKAARSVGAKDSRIIFRHILPNLVSPISVQTTFTFGFCLLQIAALDFLGLGVDPQIPSWGNMLSESQMYITRAPWLLIFPGLCIIFTVLSFNIVGDFLRDELDPRFRSIIR
ncbi:MAG: ABC transporter permease [Atribacterota bacterium]|nr:ABC transporter permease [Atribacterota bacterium]